jgi:hypothetical protein
VRHSRVARSRGAMQVRSNGPRLQMQAIVDTCPHWSMATGAAWNIQIQAFAREPHDARARQRPRCVEEDAESA